MRRTVLLVLLALAVVPYFVGLGDSAIWDANEAFYVETPRQMVETGDYVNPSFNGAPRFNKPPLSYWIVAGFYRAFGTSIVTERVAIALGALGLMVAAFLIARRAFSVEAGLVAALAIASAPRVVMFARRIFIDVYVTMFMGLTLLFLVLAESQPERRRRHLAWMYVTMGLAFMTKGPIAVVLPGLVILAYLALEGRLADLRRFMIPAGALIVAAIVLPWYAALYAEHGGVYIRKFFIDENLGRYAAPYDATATGRGLFFYGPVLLTDLFPWSVFVPAALWFVGRAAWAARGRRGVAAAIPRRLATLLILWTVVIVGFFTFSHTKQDLYIFPAVSAIAALIGAFLAEAGTARRGEAPPLVRWMTCAAGAFVAAAGAGILFLFTSPARVYAIDGAAATGGVAIAAGLATAAFAARRRTFAAVAVIGAAAVAINWIFVLQALPSFRKYQPVPAMAARIEATAGSSARVAYYRMALPSLVYYLHRPVLELFEPTAVANVFKEGETYCLMTQEDYETLQGQLPGPTCVVARRPVFDVKIGNVLALKPVSELLLVSNRCE